MLSIKRFSDFETVAALTPPSSSLCIDSAEQEGSTVTVVGKAPVAELFGFAGDVRSATEGRAMWSTEFAGFETVPAGMLRDVVKEIRKRKGLKENIPEPADYLA